jgi:hypothetical protein
MNQTEKAPPAHQDWLLATVIAAAAVALVWYVKSEKRVKG